MRLAAKKQPEFQILFSGVRPFPLEHNDITPAVRSILGYGRGPLDRAADTRRTPPRGDHPDKARGLPGQCSRKHQGDQEHIHIVQIASTADLGANDEAHYKKSEQG